MMGLFIILLLNAFAVITSGIAIVSPAGERSTLVGSADNKFDEVIRYAGSVDGKTFFAIYNPTQTFDWFKSFEACKAMGMKLAEITSQAQADMIHQMSNSSQIDNFGYWVAARDAWELRQFSWSSTGNEVTGVNAEVYNGILQPLSCAWFYPRQNMMLPLFAFFPCTTIQGYRLCEVPTSSYSIWSKYI